MYGDCQVMSSMGGNVVSSETLFSSPIQNPNFNFISTMPFQPFSSILPKEENSLLHRGKDEMLESGSGSEQMEDKSGNEQENSSDQLLLQQPGKKKRYHRHTARQIQEMEALFKECPHPDDKQRMKLSQDLGLKPRQVKFWFQNRRTQMKAQQDRNDNQILRAENETLKSENFQLQAALRNVSCPNCGGPAMIGDMGLDEQQLRLENARLREELDRVCCMTSRFTSRPMGGISGAGPHHPLMPPSLDLDMSIYSRHFPDHMAAGADHNIVPVPMMPQEPFPDNGLLLEEEKSLAIELAMSSVDELVKMCQSGSPLWVRKSENGREVLNVEEHARMFPWAMNLKQNDSSDFKTEATRHTDVVIMNSITLVDSFVDGSKWVDLFPSIVSRAKTLQVITADASGQPINGSLQLMFAELQYLSPLVPTREAHFLRYCRQNSDHERTWVIVDFPVDSFHDVLQYQPSLPRYRRRPSGCIIQDMPNGYSRVTWVEHAEIEEKPVHQTFSHFVQSGMAFGAPRWLALLKRQCERVASLMARNISDLGVMHSPESRKNMMKLSQRMLRTFCVNISTSGGQSWTAVSDSPDDTVRITTRKVTVPGQPNGLILSAVSTTWLPFPDYHVFDLLRDEGRRSQLEVLSNGSSLQKIAHIANGSDPGNCISLLRINVASNSTQPVELMLQESCTDKSGSVVVYSTMEVDAIQLVMSGGDPSCIPILPLGFVIVPAELASENNNNATGKTGCLLTVGLQVLASTNPSARLSLPSVNAINNHLSNTVRQIMAALGGTATTITCADNGGSGSSSGVDHGTTTPATTATTVAGPKQ
ncbi:homeobox-leucine zipper protein HDG5 [Humulus lupulus]|uniref:homeobox-leucine zipper protein HDG5 n=1 Tax=Humulus lupulus TaxID=3486 RepID=UPI002B411563|nr:homeobox-leucine zipper protein HDG5 [Humulus lupulus]XP_062073525.1 homeobox-leucine zipper protein HDG5 [Humulus lupulus]XP_062073526.1 homeobox-leucine zipper protein HDG5 [Humulus lupulus]XP_062073527.1 homeobox-leucine zipper protein HDG5 [Humulus lupulus]